MKDWCDHGPVQKGCPGYGNGTADAHMDPLNIDVILNGVHVAKESAPFEDKKLVSFAERLVSLEVSLNVGSAFATVMTNDLSHDYVEENSAYST